VDHLSSERCTPQHGPAATRETAESLLGQLRGWTLDSGAASIRKTFTFKDYYETMAFVNAVAWIAHREDHHPTMEVGYDRLVVVFSTHSVSGLSRNDFISAAKIDALGLA
jgi:4a-hydroxytetrahydrobiopterin dehydratase